MAAPLFAGLSFLGRHSGEFGRFPSRFNHHGRFPFDYDQGNTFQ